MIDQIVDHVLSERDMTPARRVDALKELIQRVSVEGVVSKVLGQAAEAAARRRAELALHDPGTICFKTCAVVGSRLLSVYDGKTEYVIGHGLSAPPPRRGTAGPGAGFYVFRNAEDALQAHFPAKSSLLFAPRALVKLRCQGPSRAAGRALVFARVTPIEVVARVITQGDRTRPSPPRAARPIPQRPDWA